MTVERELPTGTVTFLFTDIEGSTHLGEALGPDRYAPLLTRHRALLRGAFEPGGGIEVLTIGDGLFVVFASAPMAVAAVAAAQRALAAEPWPADGQVRVRMGLHTGQGWLDADGSYVGHDVNRAARIAGAGHGGQVLISDATRAVVADRLPDGVTIRDLGEHRLKDLQPERILQLEIAGLDGDFPPIRSLDARPNNLPTQLTTFVGREHELAEAERLLGQVRLLTLTGPGGTGKTRLSLQLAAAVAGRFPDGVFFVALEPVREGGLVAPTIAAVLGLTESAERSAEATLAAHLANRRLLLVLDNFEQVLEAGPIVADLLRAAPDLHVLVTSRAPLRVSGEQEYPVPGLPIPPDIERLSIVEREQLPGGLRAPGPEPEIVERFEAVRLFVSRAAAVRPDFVLTRQNAPAVAAICARLQGMPLAIELAAARIRLLSPEAIRDRLDQQLDLLAGGARDLPDRQRTLRGAIAWSYDLLDEGCRKLLDRLSVFVGGFDLETAEQVCGPATEVGVEIFDGISTLTDHSLIRPDERAGDVRLRMLDTIREYAHEHLVERGDAAEIEARHRAVLLDLARRAMAELMGDRQREWLDRLEREHDNLRAALMGALEAPDPATALEMGFALWRFWQQRGHLNEARQRLEAIERQPWARDDPTRWARLQEALGGVAYWQARQDDAARHYDAALDHWESVGDKAEIANALYNRSFADVLPTMMATVQADEAQIAVLEASWRGRHDRALELYREIGDRRGEANVQWAIGTGEFFLNRAEKAALWFDLARRTFEEVGDRTMEAWAFHMLGSAQLKLGQAEEAEASVRAAIRHFHEVGDVSGLTLVLDDLSSIEIARGNPEMAGRLWGAARHLQAETGANLAEYVDDSFESVARSSARTVLGPEDLARYAAEGAALTLDEAIALALGMSPEDLPVHHEHAGGVSSSR